jgi:tellurite resistance protein TerA
MGIDYNKRPKKADPAPDSAPISTRKAPQESSSPVSTTKAGPVNLTKRGETVNLTKSSSGAPIRLNLNWNQRPAGGGGGGFMKRLAGGGGNIDLDLGCMWELTTGHKGVVQALGNAFGDVNGPPFVQLDKDDRSGAATDGENLFVSGENSAYIKRLAVFAFIYEGVKKWSQADAVVTIHSADEPVTIHLDETRDGVGMCVICIIEGSASGFAIERQVQYVSGHRELDEMFGWGLNWRAGRK